MPHRKTMADRMLPFRHLRGTTVLLAVPVGGGVLHISSSHNLRRAGRLAVCGPSKGPIKSVTSKTETHFLYAYAWKGCRAIISAMVGICPFPNI